MSKQKGKKSSETIQNFSTLIEYIIEYLTMFYVIMWCKESLFPLFTSLIRDSPGHTIYAIWNIGSLRKNAFLTKRDNLMQIVQYVMIG